MNLHSMRAQINDGRGELPSSFRREPSLPPLPPGNAFVRFVTARVLASVHRVPLEEVVRDRYPGDAKLQLLTRAVSAPAMTTTAGWADVLARTIVIDALEALGPATAGARLLLASTVLNFDGYGIISAPGFVADATQATFVAEGAPIPVRQLGSAAVQMQPHKLATIAVLTDEMIRSSNAETLIGDTLIRAAAAGLDAILFDANPGTAVRPPGLRNGIAALTASTNTSAWDAYFEDASALITSVSAVGGAGPFFMIAGPGRATEMHLRALGQEGVPYFIYGSAALGNNLMAVAPAAVVCALSPEPEIETADAATVHMDTAPADLVGTGGAVAGGQKGMFQTDAIALKMRWRITWALRDVRGVAWLTPSWK